MPTISRFYGVSIKMYYNDHAPPHLHGEYDGNEAVYAIDTLEVLRGSLPRRAHALVLEWIALHRLELMQNWEAAREARPLQTIEPLE